jgi:uncharacterized protein YqgC (DUF456 family)
MTKLQAFNDAFRRTRSTQLLVSCLLSTILVLLACFFMPALPAAILLFPAYLLTVRFFATGAHAGTPLEVAIILVSIVLYGTVSYLGIRLIMRHWSRERR